MSMFLLFFFNDTATTEIYTFPYTTLFRSGPGVVVRVDVEELPQRAEADGVVAVRPGRVVLEDRKSTRLNSSHANISYAVFCLKKKTRQTEPRASRRRVRHQHTHVQPSKLR